MEQADSNPEDTLHTCCWCPRFWRWITDAKDVYQNVLNLLYVTGFVPVIKQNRRRPEGYLIFLLIITKWWFGWASYPICTCIERVSVNTNTPEHV
jgi:hypothetical protein